MYIIHKLYIIQYIIIMLRNSHVNIRTLPKIITYFHISLFISKLKMEIKRMKKQKLLIKEWIYMENTTLKNIQIYCNLVKKIQNPTDRKQLLHGVQEIKQNSEFLIKFLQQQSVRYESQKFISVLQQKCKGYQSYQQFISSYIQKKNFIQSALIISKQQLKVKKYSKISTVGQQLQEYIQKIVFKTYHFALILSKLISFINENHQKKRYIVEAVIQHINNLNKKFDRLIKKQQLESQYKRLSSLLHKNIQGELLLCQKCISNQKHASLYIFKQKVYIEVSQQVQQLVINQFTIAFKKDFTNSEFLCIIFENRTVHLLFYTKKAKQIVMSIINDISKSKFLIKQRINQKIEPFLKVQILAYQKGISPLSRKQKSFLMNFSLIHDYQHYPSDSLVLSGSFYSMGMSNIFQEQIQEKQLNETVSLTLQDLKRIKNHAQKDYEVYRPLTVHNFGNKLTESQIVIVSWQAYLNDVLRSYNVLNSPISFLKKLRISEILLEVFLINFNNKKQTIKRTINKCNSCSIANIDNWDRYLRLRQQFLLQKYTKKNKNFCYHIFDIIKHDFSMISEISLKNCEQFALWRSIIKGQIDYVYRKSVSSQKQSKIQVFYVSTYTPPFQVPINQFTLIAEVIDYIAFKTNAFHLSNYRLFLISNGTQYILRNNEMILPIVEDYGIQCKKNYEESFKSKLFSLGKYFKNEKNILFLKKVLYYPITYQISVINEWQTEKIFFDLRENKLFVEYDKPLKNKLLALYYIYLQKIKNPQENLKQFELNEIQPFLSISMQFQYELSLQEIQKQFQQFKYLSKRQLNLCLKQIAQSNIFYEKYSIKMKVLELKDKDNQCKDIDEVILAMGCSEIIIVKNNGKILLKNSWNVIQIKKAQQGIRFARENLTILLSCKQNYQIKQILYFYRQLEQFQRKLKLKTSRSSEEFI